jgi:predicted dinucleotide-binding enzyme
MGYATIGFGNIGQALAKAFARNGIEVSVATTRDPESFASAAAGIGPDHPSGRLPRRRAITRLTPDSPFARKNSTAP